MAHLSVVGGSARRYELGETSDPRRLVPGNPDLLYEAASALRDHCRVHDHISTRLTGLPLAGWGGMAADAYAARSIGRIRRHDNAAEATRTAAEAITALADALTWAQRRATEAITIYDRAEDPATSRTGDRAQADRGAADTETCRAEARELLDRARDHVRDVADRACTQLQRAIDTIPDPPRTQAGTLPHPAEPTQPRDDPAAAPDGTRRDQDPATVVVVRPGDSLSEIAARELADADRWPEIAAANPDITDPDLIHPGQRVLIPDTATAPGSDRPTPNANDTGPCATDPAPEQPGAALPDTPPPDSIPDSTPDREPVPPSPADPASPSPPSPPSPPSREPAPDQHEPSISVPPPPEPPVLPGPQPGPSPVEPPRSPTPGVDTTPTPEDRPDTGPVSGDPTGADPLDDSDPEPVHPSVGVDLGTGVFVTAGVAALASAALLLARRRDQREYQPGTSTTDPTHPTAEAMTRRHSSAVPPVVRQLAVTLGRARTKPAADDPPTLPLQTPGPVQAPAPVPTVATGPRRRPPFHLPIGMTPSRTAARVDLTAIPALALRGERLPDIARAILLACLTPTGPHRRPLARVLLTSADAAHLLGPEPIHPSHRHPDGLHIVDHLGDALRMMNRRDNHHRAAPRGGPYPPPLVLISPIPPLRDPTEARLHRTLIDWHRYGICAVLLGAWDTPITLQIAPDATVNSTSDPATVPEGTRLFTTPQRETRDLLTTFITPPPPTAPPRKEETTTPRTRTTSTTATAASPAAPPMATPPERPAAHQPAHDTTPDTTPPSPDDRDDEQLAAAAHAETDPAHAEADAETDIAARLQNDTSTTTTTDPRSAQQANNSASTESPDATAGQSAEVVAPHISTSHAPTRPITVSVFGRLQIHTNTGGEPNDIASKLSDRRRELWIYLATHPAGAHQDHITTDLWPTSTVERPIGLLHSAVSRLRAALAAHTRGYPPVLGPEDDHYRLNPDVVDVDYWKFDAAVTILNTAQTDRERADAAREIIALYQSELAPSITAEWIEPVREHARKKATDAATALARLTHANDPDHAIGILEHAITVIAPYTESLYQLLIKLQLKQGRPKAAARTLDTLTAQLARIDDQPSAATFALIAVRNARNL